MNPITLTALGSLVPQFYQCGDCKAVYHLINKGLADQCCSPAMVKCMREGCEERKEKTRTMCKKHGDEYSAQQEAARWAKAETVPDNGEQVTNGEGDYWDCLESYADELEPGTPAHFVWPVRRVYLKIDAEIILQRIVEDWWNVDDHESPDLKGDNEFAEACRAFEEANKMHYLYEPDYTKKLAVDAIPGTEDEDERMLTRQECEKLGMVFGTDEDLRNI